MIEENIIEWIKISDSIQKLDMYNNKFLFFFKGNYLLSQYSNFSLYFYLFVIFIFFGQLWEINLINVDVERDSFLKLIKSFDKFFIFQELVNSKEVYNLVLGITITFYLLSVLLFTINIILFNYKKKISFLIYFNALLNILNIYFFHCPSIELLFKFFICFDDVKVFLCPINGIVSYFSVIFALIYLITSIIGVIMGTLYINNIGSINFYKNNKKINSNYTTIIVVMKMIFSTFHFILNCLINQKNDLFFLIYEFLFFITNLIISIYSYSKLFYYDYYIDAWFHYGWYYSTWFSINIFFKKLLRIQDITLFIILGLIIITIAINLDSNYRTFKLITEFNIFETNKIRDIEIYNALLLYFLQKNDNESKILISGIVERVEEYLNTNPELYTQYQKLLNDKHLRKKFSSANQLTILSIILFL